MRVGWRSIGPTFPIGCLIETDRCDGNWFLGWSCHSTASGSGDTHSTRVAGILLGSIEQGQDANFPGTGTAAQIDRSGMAREAEFRYYRHYSSTAFRKAIENAVAEGVDIINLSFAFASVTQCSGTADLSGIRGAIMAAENAGVLVVGTTGNSRSGPCDDAGVCEVEFPAALTDIMAIGWLSTATTGANFPTADISALSDCGRPLVTLDSGQSRRAPMVDLVTYGRIAPLLGAGTDGYDPVGGSGSSIAAPIISGAAVLARNWMYDVGFSSFSTAYGVRVNLLLMGDASFEQGGVMSRNRRDVHWGLGFGRLKFRWFSNPKGSTAQLGPTAGWRTQNLILSTGETVTFSVNGGNPMPAGVLGWKLAAIADENSYSDMPDLNLRVVDTCAPGGTVTLETAQRRAGRWRLVVDTFTGIAGRCLEVRITADSTDNGLSSVWVADYYFSNSIANHLVLVP